MNIKYFLMTAAIVVATSSMAMAMGNDKPMMDGKGKEMTFEEKKSKMLERMSERIAAMQKKQACAQAAATQEAMQACFPNMGKKRGGHMKEGMKKEHMMKKDKVEPTEPTKSDAGAGAAE